MLSSICSNCTFTECGLYLNIIIIVTYHYTRVFLGFYIICPLRTKCLCRVFRDVDWTQVYSVCHCLVHLSRVLSVFISRYPSCSQKQQTESCQTSNTTKKYHSKHSKSLQYLGYVLAYEKLHYSEMGLYHITKNRWDWVVDF